MNKLIQRLLLFFIVGPLFLLILYFLPHYNFLLYHIEIIIAGILGTCEIYKILEQKLNVFSKFIICTLGSIIIITSYLIGGNFLSENILLDVIGIILVLIFFSEFIFSLNGNFTKSIERICTGIFMLVYPWGLLLYFSKLSKNKNAVPVIITFFLMGFACDSIAWFFGMLFGRNSRGFVKASPKKSLAGFVGGIVGAISIAFLVTYLFKKEFGNYLVKFIIIAILSSISLILGDIVESIIKRSASLKDSGNVIMGRGGILDSIDSLLIAAPIFYISFKFLIGGF